MSQTRDSIADIWGERTPYREQWPVRADEHTSEEPERWVQSACVLCSYGCACDIGVKDGRIVGVRGRAGDRVNRGRMGPKGLNGWKANQSGERLTHPLVRTNGKNSPLRRASWDEAMSLIVSRSKEIRARYTGDALACYNTGQLFLEEYHALGTIWRAGLGSSAMDGNTRLCTATSSQALKETFGSDGEPGSYSDFDVTDCLLLCGHNIANTQTVGWMRLLDRRCGPNPPRLVVIDPRATATALEADVHLAPRIGTNVAVLNGLIHLIIAAGHIDREFIALHTKGFAALQATVAAYPPERVQAVSGVPAETLRRAAQILGTAPTLVSTALQGVYQSNQATAAACQVNNLNLVRGLISKPGCTVFQMNGQPSAQNARETGCNGEMPLFINTNNPDQVRDLAARLNVEPHRLPTWHRPMHAMEIFRAAQLGSIKMLWIACTNPAVSMPDSHRIREILSKPGLFVIAQDGFENETTALADVVLPAAIWGEKTGTFTNADRTVHLSRQAIEPPGEARSDLAIFLDYAQRMEFKDKDGAPLIKYHDAQSAFDHWAQMSRGSKCDYSGLSYQKLSGESGIQWPCNAAHPNGAERLYTDFHFPTSAAQCQEFGHDLHTGAEVTPEEYKANDPAGRAILKAAHYIPFIEEPDEHFPFRLSTGRVVYHWHTRTKTARSPELQRAAPEPFVQISREDAHRLGISEGELLEVSSSRGSVRAPARVGGIEPGQVFLPMHYGSWDENSKGAHTGTEQQSPGRPTAANELTITMWDPVSKQPTFKTGAVQVRKVSAIPLKEKVAGLAGHLSTQVKQKTDTMLSSAHLEKQHLPIYIGLLTQSQDNFLLACRTVSAHHPEEAEIVDGLRTLGAMSQEGRDAMKGFVQRYGTQAEAEPGELRQMLMPSQRPGAFGVLRDLHALYVLSSETQISLIAVMQASKALRDDELLAACGRMEEQGKLVQAWLLTQIKHRAPHTLVVPQ